MTKVVINNYIHNGDNITYVDNSTNINLTKIENTTFNEVDQSQFNLTYAPTVNKGDQVSWKVTEKDKEATEELSDTPVSEESSESTASTSSTDASTDSSSTSSENASSSSTSTESSSSSISSSSSSSSSSSTSNSSTASSSSSTKASSSEATLEQDEYLDKIQAEIRTLKSKDPSQSASSAWYFLDNKDDFNQNASLIAGLDMKSLYEPKPETLTTDISKKTESSAKKVAEEIYAKLKAKASELTSAKYLQISLTKESGRDAFNVKVYKEVEESSSSTSSSSSSSSGLRSSSSSYDDYEDMSSSSSESTFSRTETSTSSSSDSYEE